MNRLLAGAVGGFTATIPMSVVMRATQFKQAGHGTRKLPPEQITDKMVNRANLDDLPRESRRSLA